jgi:hypothetical protein
MSSSANLDFTLFNESMARPTGRQVIRARHLGKRSEVVPAPPIVSSKSLSPSKDALGRVVQLELAAAGDSLADDAALGEVGDGLGQLGAEEVVRKVAFALEDGRRVDGQLAVDAEVQLGQGVPSADDQNLGSAQDANGQDGLHRLDGVGEDDVAVLDCGRSVSRQRRESSQRRTSLVGRVSALVHQLELLDDGRFARLSRAQQQHLLATSASKRRN